MAVSLLAPFSLLYFYTLPDLTFLYSAANKYYHHSSFPLSLAFSLWFSVCDLRSENMRDRLQESLSAHRNKLVSLLSRYVAKGKGILQSHDLIGELDNVYVVNEDESMKILKDSPFSKGLQSAQAMMLNDRIQNISKLQSALARAEEYLSKLPLSTPYSEFEFELQGVGFERGWGDIAQRVSKTIHLLLEILQAPDPSTLETFLGRIPVVFNVVIVSPHDYFGQANVLGLPDTGGQIVYKLDQVRALEDGMLLRIQKQGLDVIPKILIVTRLIPDAKGTTCNQILERISGTEHTHILHVPFRTENGILQKWISRFDVWPYLETFAELWRMTSRTRETYLILEITFKHKFQKEIKRLGIENLEDICEGQLWAI